MSKAVILQNLLLALVLSTRLQKTFSEECNRYFKCSDCITQNSTCAWCNDMDIFMHYANDTTGQLEPAKLCGTVEELDSVGCGNVYNPTSTVNIVDDYFIGSDLGSGEAPQVTSNVYPNQANIVLRPGIKESLTVTIAPPKSVSVDMYVLMDLSFTMKDDLETLRGFGNELVELMQNLTDEFRIGFGSYVDKPVDPFIGRLNRETPCNQESKAEADACIPTYTYRHHLDFTSNATRFAEELNKTPVSGSDDEPEALFDALLQVAVCEDLIGWRPIGTARRIVLAMTDGDYHTALDGRLAGLLRKPDSDCKLDPVSKYYDYAKEVDYPSSTFIAEILNNNRITPIFAAGQDVRTLYNDLSTIIRSAFIGEISQNSANLLKLIEEQYRVLSTTVIPLFSGDSDITGLSIEARPLNDCGNGNISATRQDTCENVVFPNEVMYELSFKAFSEFCNRPDPRSSYSTQLLFIGFGDVTVNFTVQCSCPCEDNKIVDSIKFCNGNGDYECSTCVCDNNHIGTTCGCATGLTAVFGCTRGGNDSSICSGRGDCVCNECQCHFVPTLDMRKYQGRYCECDPFLCPFGANKDGEVLPCAGQGLCECNGQCGCDEGYFGSSCDCHNRMDTCIRPGENIECSGAGQCRCGVCVCNDYSERRGEFCQECVTCRGSCAAVLDCVRCLISDNCAEGECSNITLTHSLEDIPNQNDTNFVFRNCSVANSNCEVIYQIDQSTLGTEDNVYIYINSNQQSFKTWNRSSSDCEPAPNVLVYTIPITIVIVIIIIAIIALTCWKIITIIVEYSEYKAWEKSQKKETWNASEVNPLFIDPTTQHTNPRYRRPVQFNVVED